MSHMRVTNLFIFLIMLALSMTAISPDGAEAQTRVDIRQVASLGRGTIEAAAWSPDGNMIAIGGSQGLWLYTNSFELVSHFDPHPVKSLAWSPDQTMIAAENPAGVTVWDVSTAQPVFTTADTICPIFSPDSARLAVSRSNGEVLILDANSGQFFTKYLRNLRSSPIGDRAPLVALTWSLDGQYVMSVGTYDRSLNTWNAMTGEIVNTIQFEDFIYEPTHCSSGASWSPDRTKLFNFASRPDNYADIWDTRTGKRLVTSADIRLGLPDTFQIAWSPDGTRLASVGVEQTITIWDAATLEQLRTYALSNPVDVEYWEPISPSITWSPDNQHLLVTSIGDARLLEVASGDEIARLQGHMAWTYSLAWSPNGDYLASGHGDLTVGRGDNRVRIWDASGSQIVNTCDGHTSTVRSIDWHPTEAIIATTGAGWKWDGTARLWDVGSCAMLALHDFQTHYLDGIDWHPDGERIAVNVGSILDQDLNEIADPPFFGSKVLWSPNGTQLAVAAYGKLEIYSAADYQLLDTYQAHTGLIRSLSWSPDSLQLAVVEVHINAGDDNTICLWNLSNQSVLVIGGHPENEFAETVWNPKFDILASISVNGRIQLWNTQTGFEIYSTDSGQDTLTSLAWSPDGTRLAVASYEGPITIWEIAR